MLKYSLRENLLTPAPDDCMAQTVDVRSYNQDELIDLMMKRGTTLTKADVAAVLQVYTEETEWLVKHSVQDAFKNRLKCLSKHNQAMCLSILMECI